MKRGDIVLIKFPFTDLSSTKVRPALVISTDDYNESREDAIFLCISSNCDDVQKFDFLLELSDPDFSSTGLKKSSVFRIDKIVILKKTLAVKKLGNATQKILKIVNNNLKVVLGLTVAKKAISPSEA